MKEPKLRFKEFQDGWQEVSLKDIVTRVTRKNSNLESELPLTISAQYGLVDQKEFFNKVVASKNLEHYILLKNGEFAYNKSYSRDYPYGAVKRLDRYQKGALSTLYIAFKPKSTIDSDFLSYYYDSSKWNNEIYKNSAEGARNHGLLNIAPDDFFNSRLYVPGSIKEQKKIADFFSDLDDQIELQSNKLESLKQNKKGYLQKMFPNDDSNKPKLRLKGFEDDWETKELKDICKSESSKLSFEDSSHIKDDKFKYPVFDVSKVIGYSDRYDQNNKYISIIKDGSGVGTVKNRPALSSVIGTMNYILPFENTDINFLNYLMLSKINFAKYKVGTGIPHIYFKDYSKTKINVPSYEEQQMIGMFFENLDQQIELQQNKLTDLKNQKKAYLQKMFI